MKMKNLQNEHLFHIFLFMEITQIWIEIQVSEGASFHDILQALSLMYPLNLNAEDTFVYERENQCRCDIDVALYSLNVQNGMVFQVY